MPSSLSKFSKRLSKLARINAVSFRVLLIVVSLTSVETVVVAVLKAFALVFCGLFDKADLVDVVLVAIIFEKVVLVEAVDVVDKVDAQFRLGSC